MSGEGGSQLVPEGDWTPVWLLPNLDVEQAIETEHAMLAGRSDERVLGEADRQPAFGTILGMFHDEFGVPVDPSVIMLKTGAPKSVFTVAAVASLRDIACICAVPAAHARVIRARRSGGIQFSDAFDPYPWMLSGGSDGYVQAMTPAVHGVHQLQKLRPQTPPATGERSLRRRDLDDALLPTLLDRWEAFYARCDDDVRHRRLFRALDMARAAARMPGGSDATMFDQGRAVALWISAFEILAHDGHVDLKSVIDLLARVKWDHKRLRAADRSIRYKGALSTNGAGELYKRLYDARNAFLHGNPVSIETLGLPSGRHALQFAAPLFGLALIGYLELSGADEIPVTRPGETEYEAYLANRAVARTRSRRLMEDAVALADEASVPDR